MKDCDVCKYSVNLIETQDTHDVSWFGGGNTYRMYESAAVGRHSHDILFSSTV